MIEGEAMNNELYNKSGCKDKTAYEALKNVRREERRKLIEEINSVAKKYGYTITSKITLKDISEDSL